MCAHVPCLPSLEKKCQRKFVEAWNTTPTPLVYRLYKTIKFIRLALFPTTNLLLS